MNKKLKYSLLIGGIIILATLPFLINFSYFYYDDTNSEYIVVYFVDNNTGVLSQEIRTAPNYESLSDIQVISLIFDWLVEPTLPNNTSVLEEISVTSFQILNRSEDLYDYHENYDKQELIINFGAEYNYLTPYQELLARASLVHTFTNLDFIDYVSIFVENQPLVDLIGNPVGPFDSFSVAIAPDIGSYVLAITTHFVDLYFVRDDLAGLYREHIFVDLDQDGLLKEVVLGELLNRGLAEENMLFFPSDLSLIDISTIENVAYIDFTNHLDTRPAQGDIAQLLSVYAIVNTLTGLDTNIDEIEFFIDSERLIEYSGYVDFDRTFKRNEDIVLE